MTISFNRWQRSLGDNTTAEKGQQNATQAPASHLSVESARRSEPACVRFSQYVYLYICVLFDFFQLFLLLLFLIINNI